MVLAVGAFGSLASVALGAVVWSFTSRKADVFTRLDNLEKQMDNNFTRLDNLEKQMDNNFTRLDNNFTRLEKQIEMRTDRLSGDIRRLSGELGAWSRALSQRIDCAHTLAALQASKAGNSGAHVSNV